MTYNAYVFIRIELSLRLRLIFFVKVIDIVEYT